MLSHVVYCKALKHFSKFIDDVLMSKGILSKVVTRLYG